MTIDWGLMLIFGLVYALAFTHGYLRGRDER